MSYITELRDELNNDPKNLGYLGIATGAGTEAEKDVLLKDLLNLVNISQDKTNITGSEMWEATDAAEFATKTDSEKTQWLAMCGLDQVNPFGPAASIVIAIFGNPASSATTTSLVSLRTFDVSRAKELGFQIVKEGHVEMARAL